MNNNDGWEEAGAIGVDAGLCWVGDPCYILHRATPPLGIGTDWLDFCKQVGHDGYTQFSYDLGHAGLGVVVDTGYGDGVYPVYVKRNAEGRIAEVRVVFISEDED